MLLPAILFISSLSVVSSKTGSFDYSKFAIVSVTPFTDEDVQAIKQLEVDYDAEILHSAKLNEAVQLMLPRRFIQSQVADRFDDWKVVVRNVQKLINKERDEIDRNIAFQTDGEVEFLLDQYHRHQEIQAYLIALEKKYPDIVQYGVAGRTWQNRSIDFVYIGTSQPNNTDRPAFYIDAATHAREWITPAVALYIADQLASLYAANDTYTRALLDTVDFFIVPVVNPDGYEYSWDYKRFWRKNMNPNGGNQIYFDCPGVDLNRNYGWYWAQIGSSSQICSDQYHGTGPFSEPETQAVASLTQWIGPRLQGFVSLHNYGQALLYSYGHAKNVFPDNVGELHQTGIEAVTALHSLYGTQFTVGTSANLFYEATGASHDWARGYLGTRFSYVLELRPSIQGGQLSNELFMVPQTQIIPIAQETWAGLKVIAEKIRDSTF